jgi:2-dehydro-3-deoxyglucarate aldolase
MNRLEAIKLIRQTLENGRYSIGSWIQIPHPSIAEIMGDSDYDWIAVDMEHGSISTHQLPDLFRAIELGGTLPLVRLASGSPEECKKSLDAGAGGVIVPMVENAKQLKRVRDFSRWPPSGSRGVAFSRANMFGKYFDEYSVEAQNPILIAMIEHINAIDNLDEILQVEGLDAILIGPYDLSASMNLTAQFSNKEFIKTIDFIKQRSVALGVPFGIHIVEPSVKDLILKVEQGYQFIAYSIDGAFLNKIANNPLSI